MPAPLLSIVHFQNVAIWKNDFPVVVSGKTNRRSILGGSESDRDLIPGLERRPGPAVAAHDTRTLAFNGPINDFAFFVLHVHENLAMRVGPNEFRHRARNGNPMRLI